MSQAEALLQNLTENVPTHTHIVADQDSYFVINPDTREIENASRTKNILMQFDHNSEKFTFELARYVEGHDMTLCNRVRVHFDNIDGETNEENADVAELYDLAVDPDDESKVLCSWTITRQATQLVGTLNFLVQYECIDDAGNSVYEWHTDIYTDVDVKRGMNNSEQTVIEYSNILEQWYQRIFGTGDAVLANITAEGEKQVTAVTTEGEKQLSAITTEGEKQLSAITTEGKKQVAAATAEGAAQKEAVSLKGETVLATIPEDYTTVANMAEEALRRKANAIELDAEGEVISVNDSSDAYLLGLNVFGRTTQKTTTGVQLAYIPDVESYENNGITWSSNGGVVTAKGNAPIHSYTPSNIHADLKGLVGTFYLSGNGKYIKVAVQYTRDGVTNYINAPQEFTLDGTETRVELYCQITTYNTDINDVAYPMVNVGTAALPWETYTGSKPGPNPEYPQELESVDNPVASVRGKNLIPFPYADTTVTKNGITFTVNDDGSIRLSGTATNVSVFTVFQGSLPLNGVFTLSGVTNDVTPSTHYMQPYVDGVFKDAQINGGRTYEINGNLTQISLYVKNGETVNCTVYPQLEIGDHATEYEPSKPVQSLMVNHTLHGIPVTSGGDYTDENGQQWICDEIDFERGMYVQRVIKKTFGASVNEAWRVYNVAPNKTHTAYQESKLCADMKVFTGNAGDTAALISNKYTAVTLTAVYNDGSQGISVSNVSPAIRMSVDACLGYSIDEFKAWLKENPFELMYPLATPIEIPLTEEEIAYYKKLKTNYHNTTVMNDRNAHMAIKYNADTLTFLRDNQPKPTDEQIQAAVDEYASQNGVQVPTDDHIQEIAEQTVGSIISDDEVAELTELLN